MSHSSTGIENPEDVAKAIGDTLGALLLGTFLSIILYGTGVHQAYRYFRLYPSDTLVIQGIVITMLLLETAQTVFSMHTCYFYLVTKYFHLDLHGVWSCNLIAVSGAIIAIVSQLFFLRRISLISFKYKIISATSLVFLLWNFGCTIYISYLGFKYGAAAMFLSHRWLTPMTYATITVVNTLVTGSLLAVLICAREHTSRPTRIPDFLTIYIVNTGVLVLACDLITLVVAITLWSTFYWVLFALMGSKLYMNTLLSVLNSRKLLVSRGIELFDTSTFGTSFLSRAKRLATVERWNVPQLPEEHPPTMVNIKVTHEVEGDDGLGTSSVTSHHDGKVEDMALDLEGRPRFG